jgi:hypothetical protein
LNDETAFIWRRPSLPAPGVVAEFSFVSRDAGRFELEGSASLRSPAIQHENQGVSGAGRGARLFHERCRPGPIRTPSRAGGGVTRPVPCGSRSLTPQKKGKCGAYRLTADRDVPSRGRQALDAKRATTGIYDAVAVSLRTTGDGAPPSALEGARCLPGANSSKCPVNHRAGPFAVSCPAPQSLAMSSVGVRPQWWSSSQKEFFKGAGWRTSTVVTTVPDVGFAN